MKPVIIGFETNKDSFEFLNANHIVRYYPQQEEVIIRLSNGDVVKFSGTTDELLAKIKNPLNES